MHVPGLKVVAPYTPADAAELLIASIRDDGPVLFVENKLLYPQKGEVPEQLTAQPLGVAAIRREGSDLTLIAYGRMVEVGLQAAEALSPEIDVEVVDLRTLVPLDVATLVESVGKTMAVLVLEEDVVRAGVGAEIAAVLAREAFYSLDAPIGRIGCANSPIPCSPVLEAAVLPDVQKVIDAVQETLSGRR
jgi:pyruvate dehydrogenase E1 component beta subunit